MGLDFMSNAIDTRRAGPDGIAGQDPQTLRVVWGWSEWAHDPASAQSVSANDSLDLIPCDDPVFGISR